MNVDELLFRAHMIGDIMPADNAKVKFTATCMDKMVEIFNAHFYNRYEEIESKFLEKGNAREEDSITLYCRVTKKLYKKNTIRLSNEYITGEWDLDFKEGDQITKTTDTKTSWSKNTFDKSRVKKLSVAYEYQGYSYMALTGAKQHSVAYCLVNGTEKSILDEKKRLEWRMGLLNPEYNETYIEKCKQIERNMIFDLGEFMKEYPHFELHSDPSEWSYDIPKNERVHEITFDRDDDKIQKMYERIKECRIWIKENLILK